MENGGWGCQNANFCSLENGKTTQAQLKICLLCWPLKDRSLQNYGLVPWDVGSSGGG